MLETLTKADESVKAANQPRKLILKTSLSPGDIVTLTAAVRDLHKAHPGSFQTDVRTVCSAIWENNPYVTSIADDDPEATTIEMHYPSVSSSNQRPRHFIEGYRAYLESQLQIKIEQGDFKGDIHISDKEKSWINQVEEIRGMGTPFWIVVAGGKHDFTAKLWSTLRWQKVVNHFKERMLFVQVGEKGHRHAALENVLDLRGKTDLRQLIRLVYHAEGIICPVTSLMHLAAAVPTKNGDLRPCVVVAGGREPRHWEAYPAHRYLDTIGMLPCCRNGGCWKSRVVPLGDNDEKNKSLCERPYETDSTIIPECLHMITAEMVIEAVESYGTIPKETEFISTPTAAPVTVERSPVTKEERMPLAPANGEVLYIWANHTLNGGHKIGDCVTSAYTCRLFAESKPWGRILMSRHRAHELNFVYKQFIKDFDVQVIDEDWPDRNLGDVQCDAACYAPCDALFRERNVNGRQFDAYREMYRRVMGGVRQRVLCGEERGLGRRNIFEYMFFGQEWAPESCPRGADFRPSAFGWSWEPTQPERSVFVCPHAFSQTNDVFTLEFWSSVVRDLVSRRIKVTVCSQNKGWFGAPPNPSYYYSDGNDFQALQKMIASQRLVLCGNTGAGWLAAASGVPLIAGEPPFFWFMDFRYRESGVPAQIFSEPDVQTVVDMVEARLIP